MCDCIASVNALRAQIHDRDEILDEKRRLTREIDIALCGEEGAARQASLCDVVAVARQIGDQYRAQAEAGGKVG